MLGIAGTPMFLIKKSRVHILGHQSKDIDNCAVHAWKISN